MALTRVKSKNFVHVTGAVDFSPRTGEVTEKEFRAMYEEPLPEIPMPSAKSGRTGGKADLAMRLHIEQQGPKERTGARVVIAKDGMFVTLERRPTVDRAWVVWVSDGGPLIELVVVEKGEDREKILAEVVKKHGGPK